MKRSRSRLKQLSGWIVLFHCISMGTAHMEMIEPAPIKSRFNQFFNFNSIDYNYDDPLGVFPCKGHHLLEPRKSTANYDVGQKQFLSLAGAAHHDGGSCQISLSYDGGGTFTVIKSIIGGCPLAYKYDFVVPTSAPHGQALLSWSWINNIGNRDYYHNCAWVDINNTALVEEGAVLDGPYMFVAQIPGTCRVAEGYDFVFPDPGPQVEYGGDPAKYTIVCENCVANTQEFTGSDVAFNPEFNATCSIQSRDGSDEEDDDDDDAD